MPSRLSPSLVKCIYIDSFSQTPRSEDTLSTPGTSSPTVKMEITTLLNAASPTAGSPRNTISHQSTCPSASAIVESLVDLPPLLDHSTDAVAENENGPSTPSHLIVSGLGNSCSGADSFPSNHSSTLRLGDEQEHNQEHDGHLPSSFGSAQDNHPFEAEEGTGTSLSSFPASSLEGQCVEILPPPEETYASEDAAIAAIHTWTKHHGFNVTKRRAFRSGSKSNIVWKRGFDCDRGGQPKCTRHLRDEDRQRPMRGSIRIGCPMKLIVRAVNEDDPSGPWMIVHTKNGSRVHNHPPSIDARVHPGHRQRAAAAVGVMTSTTLQEMVASQTAAGISTGRVRASLIHADPDSFVIPQDIANMRNRLRQQELSTQTAMEALFARLEADGFYFRWEVDPQTKRVLYLFWAHPGTLALYRLHCDVVGMDCTYKTNKYKLPLLNIIALTAFNTVLPVAQCWLPREREEDYTWAMTTLRSFLVEMQVGLPRVFLTDRELAAMNALDAVFAGVPAMICRWHMNKNVISKARQVLGQVQVQNPAPGQPKYENTWQTDAFMAVFYAAVDAATEEEFERKRAELRELNLQLAAYLDKHWWKFKVRIVRAWTDKFQHFGVRDTSFVEGTHAKCKIWLRGCRGDLLTVYKSMLPWWNAAASATRLLAQRNAIRTPYLLQGNRFAAVVRVISVWALTQTHALWEDARAIVFNRLDRDECTGVFRTVHGRPCVHELISVTEANGARILLPTDFALHWWINREQASATPARIQEPAYNEDEVVRRRRQRRSRRSGIGGTRRDPVFFERVDLNNPATPPATRFREEQSLEEALTILPPVSALAEESVQDTSDFHEAFVPARFWGYARWS
jgi:hypothetical protein